MAAQMTNTRSERLSILEPSPLSTPIFLAIGPSIMSEMPHQAYNNQNGRLNAGKNSMMTAATPLDTDMMLGRVLT